MSSELNDLVRRYGAEQLPNDVSNVLLEYFLKKPVAEVNLNNLFVTVDANEINEEVLISNTTTELDFIEEHNSPLIDCAFSETESPFKSITENDISQFDDEISNKQYLENYFGKNGCGCERQCHTRFSVKAFESRLDALNLDRYCPHHVNHQHLLLLGAMNALLHDKSNFSKKGNKNKLSSSSEAAKINFKFRGVDVCRPFFLYAYGCGIKRFNNVWKQFKSKGITPAPHENATSTKVLAKVISTTDLCKAAVTFILHFAQENALQLPGRLVILQNGVQSTHQDLYLLPNQSNLGRREIYERYEHASEELHQETVSYALWTEMWNLKCANVLTINNQMELCKDCRVYHQFILRKSTTTKTASNSQPPDESEMMKRALEYAVHLSVVQGEAKTFKETVDRCKAQYEELVQRHKTDFSSALRASFLAELPTMHYSIDWFSTISLPIIGGTGSFAGSSLHFHSAYKVALFGVAIEPLRQYLLYIVPEFVAHSQSHLPSLTLSLLEHAFSVAGPFKENEALIDCLNGALDQAKSGLLVAYFSWRTLVGKHDRISLNFLSPGHLNTWNDLFMGALKKRLRCSMVTSLADIKSIAESCAMDQLEGDKSHTEISSNDLTKEHQPPQKRSLIRAFLVGDDTESVTLPLYDWTTKLAPISKLSTSVLQTYNHFKVDIDCPGFVVCNSKTSYTMASATTQTTSYCYRLVSNEAITQLDAEMPGKLHLEPLSLERRLYLYRTIKPYFEAVEKLKTAKVKKKKSDDAKNTAEVKALPLISKLWAVDENLLMSENEVKTNCEFFTSKRKGQTKEVKNQKKTVPKCSYCGELGHKETVFGNVRCPKKKLDGQMPSTLENVEAPLLPHVSLFDEEDYRNDEIDFEIDENVFNGIVSEAEDIQQQQQELQNTEQISPTTTITFLN